MYYVRGYISPDDYTFSCLFRVRPLSNKEIKAGDNMAVQFPGGGQIYVSILF